LRIHIGHDLSRLENLIEQVKKNSRNVGAVVVFIGVVREKGRNSSKVIKLHYESQTEIARSVLNKLAEEIREKYGLLDIAIEHRIGDVGVGENTLYILCASEHRREAIMAMEETLERLKTEVPIWKKEITDSGESWIREARPQEIEVIIDGKPIPLNPFVRKILSRTILAMLSTLRGVDIQGNERLVLKVFRYAEDDSGSSREKKIWKDQSDN